MIASLMERYLKDGKTNWRCLQCHKESHRKADMVRHVEAFHVETMGFSCDQCGKTLKTRESLRSHKTLSHKDFNKMTQKDIQHIDYL